MTLLRERMAEDLRIRYYSPRTVECYVSMMARFAREFAKPPGQLGPEEIRAFQVRLIEKKVSWTQFNQAVCALRFFYRVTLPRDFAVEHIPFAKTKKKLPTVLSVDEVRRLLGVPMCLKHRAVLSLIYGTGARLNEATHLRISDIDGARMMVHICNGKGGKPRMVPMSTALRELLRDYWRAAHPRDRLFRECPTNGVSGTEAEGVKHSSTAPGCGPGRTQRIVRARRSSSRACAPTSSPSGAAPGRGSWSRPRRAGSGRGTAAAS
jgi:site-specific recombinase XerD